MRTVSETAVFQRYADGIWSEEERLEFISWLAMHPQAGDVIPGTGGCRKVRWSRRGQGKRGGTRIICFNATDDVIWLLIIYTKSRFDALPTSFLIEMRKAVDDAL